VASQTVEVIISLLRALSVFCGLTLMGYTITISNYQAWQNIALDAVLMGGVLAFFTRYLPVSFTIRLSRSWNRLSSSSWRLLFLVALALGLVTLQNWWKGKLPEPTTYDELAYLLSAETLLQGRWTNPTPVGWEHFETIHVTLSPSYHGKYQPGMGLMLALGNWLFREAYAGVLLALVAALLALDWMFRRWLPARWALLASVIATFTLVDIWNSYYVGGPLAVLAGALLLGVWRVVLDRGSHLHHGLLLGLSFAIFFWTRPFEGAVLSAGVCLHALMTLVWQSRWGDLTRLLPGILIVIIPVGWLQLRYNESCVGTPWKLPYLEHEKQYAISPLFLWQPRRAEQPIYRHRELQRFNEHVMTWYDWQHAGKDRLAIACFKLGVVWLFFGNLLWLAWWLTLPDLLSQRWTRHAVLLLLYFVAALMTVTWLFHHYVAPCLGLITSLMVMALRHLNCSRWKGQAFGRSLALFFVISFLAAMVVKQTYAAREELFPGIDLRQGFEQQLIQEGGQHLVLVEYHPDQPPGQEWVFNNASIDKQQILWARSMSAEKNTLLRTLYPNRQVWLLHIHRRETKLQSMP
jgi:hypothetical protein